MTLGNGWILDNVSLGERRSTAYPANNFALNGPVNKNDLNSVANKSNFKN